MKNDNAKVKLLGRLYLARFEIKTGIEQVEKTGMEDALLLCMDLTVAKRETESALGCAGKNDADE